MDDDLDLLMLRAPAGNGRPNDPDDIEALDGALRQVSAYAPPPEYASGAQRYATEPMIDALARFQEQNGLKIDGYAEPGGPTERAINNRLLGKPDGAGLLFDPPSTLSDMVGNGFANKREDVATLQRMLGALGYMPEDPFDRPAGFIDERTTDATRRLQRDHGLKPDGWMAPGGETETALRNSISDLTRAKARDWFAFAERAGKAQARLVDDLAYRRASADSTGNTTDRDEASSISPIAWRGAPPGEFGERPPAPPSEKDGEPRVEPAQTAPGDWIVPWLFLGLPALLGLGEANRRRTEASRQASGKSDVDDGKTEYIPPRLPNEPFRGPDPTKPPLKPHEMRPAPSPSEPPPNLPGRNENIPPRLDPRDFIEILPDQSDLTAHLPIIVENRQGSPATKRLNRILGEPTLKHGKKIFGELGFRQIGGPAKGARGSYKEEFDAFRDKKAFGITSNAGSSYEDVTFMVDYRGVQLKLIINTVTVSHIEGQPTARENQQRAKLVYNVTDHAFVIDVNKPRQTETVDPQAWDRFVEVRLRLIKSLIDREFITKEGYNQKLIDLFGPHRRK